MREDAVVILQVGVDAVNDDGAGYDEDYARKNWNDQTDDADDH